MQTNNTNIQGNHVVVNNYNVIINIGIPPTPEIQPPPEKKSVDWNKVVPVLFSIGKWIVKIVPIITPLIGK